MTVKQNTTYHLSSCNSALQLVNVIWTLAFKCLPNSLSSLECYFFQCICHESPLITTHQSCENRTGVL